MAPDQGGGGHFHTDRIGLLGAAWGRSTKTVAAWLRCPHCTIIQSYACTRRASFHLICSHLQAQESAVLGGQLDLMEQLEEDFGQPRTWADGTRAILCAHCNIFFANFKQYRSHADHYGPHRRRSPLLIKNKRS